MDEQLFETELVDTLSMLDVFSDINEDVIYVDTVNTFEQEGILTRNKGVVVALSDGSEFRVTIVKVK